MGRYWINRFAVVAALVASSAVAAGWKWGAVF
jgi:hypothetical protein